MKDFLRNAGKIISKAFSDIAADATARLDAASDDLEKTKAAEKEKLEVNFNEVANKLTSTGYTVIQHPSYVLSGSLAAVSGGPRVIFYAVGPDKKTHEVHVMLNKTLTIL